MKSLFVSILLLSLKVLGVPEAEPRYYYLKCPNGQLITSVAVELEKEFIHVDYGALGRTDFIPWSLEFEYRHRHYEMGSTALERKVTWKEDIHFVPSHLGLPDKINGCDVVPLVVYFDDMGYVGSLNDYSLLDKYNRLILNLHFANPKIAKVVFSDKFKILPPREKYLFIKYQINYQTLDFDYGTSFDLKIPVSQFTGSIVDIKDCTWWDDNTPKKCNSVSDEGLKIGNHYFLIKNVEFWKNGIIKNAETSGLNFWPKDWYKPSGTKIQCSPGPISYRFNGELDSCVDMKEVP